MAKQSAGLVLYREREDGVEVFLVHPGGPFWAKKDAGAWSIPKGEHDDGEDALSAALREFREETGLEPPTGVEWRPLGSVRQRGGKIVAAWAAPGEVDERAVRSNTFEMEWPPRSGRRASFPEVDRAAWFALPEARERIVSAQAGLLDRLSEALPPS